MKYKKPSPEEIKSRLTPEQYVCTQEGGTESPFHNAYWNHHEDGIYVDVVSAEPLFSSLDKYDSGTGWPSFTKPIAENSLSLHEDYKLYVPRTEIKSKVADSHLGHVFDDGPPSAGGLRYCVNSVALKFVPLQKMQELGYGNYLFDFADKLNWQIATLAGGCFWGLEKLLAENEGVIETQVGYTGSDFKNPGYSDVKTGTTGHAETVRILFDPLKISYEDLLLDFFRIHDPTTKDRQGNDQGTQYRSEIFYADASQKNIAESVISRVQSSGQWNAPIVTQLSPALNFWAAEEEHQKYLKKYPEGYTCHLRRPIKF